MNFANIAFACVLALAAILAGILVARARPDARRYVQFAAALYGTLALASFVAALTGNLPTQMLSATIALIVMSLAPASLALALADAFEGSIPPLAATTALVLACAAGLVSSATGARFIAMAALFASVCTILTFAARRWRKGKDSAIQALVAGLALLAGAAADMTGGLEAQTSLALFSAAALLGASLAAAKRLNLAVEEPAVPDNVITLIRRES